MLLLREERERRRRRAVTCAHHRLHTQLCRSRSCALWMWGRLAGWLAGGRAIIDLLNEPPEAFECSLNVLRALPLMLIPQAFPPTLAQPRRHSRGHGRNGIFPICTPRERDSGPEQLKTQRTHYLYFLSKGVVLFEKVPPS
jgi:hypothetical protein